MKSVPFDFNGKTYALSFTAEALFTVYDKYGQVQDILAATHAAENTPEGWKGACWLGALLASQGELQRRYMGEDPQPMLSMEELRRCASPVEMLDLRRAITEALALGFRRDNIPDDEAEVDAVLSEISWAEKKTRALAASVQRGLQQVRTRLGSLSGRSSS